MIGLGHEDVVPRLGVELQLLTEPTRRFFRTTARLIALCEQPVTVAVLWCLWDGRFERAGSRRIITVLHELDRPGSFRVAPE